MTRAGLSILAAVLLIAPLAARLASRDAATSDVAARFILPGECRPEPGERSAYLACALGLPALIFAGAWAGRRLVWPARIDELASLTLLGLALTVAVVAVRREGNAYLLMNGFREAPWWSMPMLALTAIGLWRGRCDGRVLRVGAQVVAGATIAAMALARVFGESAPDAHHSHFEPLYHPTVQVALGKTVLVDMGSQYGLYPHAVAPVVSALGGGVLAFTLVMAALVAGVLAGVWSFLGRATGNRGVALLGFLAFVACGSFTLLEPGANDPYFQYMPIRMVFPTASVWLSWRYLRGPTRGRYIATMAVLGVGPLWNLDAGLPALASWVGMLGYRELAATGRRPLPRLARIAAHAAVGALSFGLAVLAYSAFALARSGRLPDFAGLAAYQMMFYTAGFFMLPMPLVGGWCLVALIYLAALAFAARGVAEGCATPRSAIAFQLAALGIGLFSYYQGRSFPRVLTLAWWPAVLLLTLFLDELVAGLSRVDLRPPRLIWAATLAAALAGPAWSLAWAPAFLRQHYASHLLTAREPSPLAPEVALLKASLAPGERALIVSRDESHLSAALGLPSAWRSSLVEAILVDDYRAIAERVDRGEFDYLYLDDSAFYPQFRDSLGLPELARSFDRATLIGSTSRARLLRARGGEPSLLGAARARLEVRYADGRAAGRLGEPPLALGPRFTIEALVRPDGPQAPRATILGDLPGLAPPYASGFALQQAGPDGNAYALFTGDGRAFFPVAEFRLEPGRWAYVAIAVGGGVSTTYLDGRPVATRPVPDPLPVAPSRLPVVVGDWRERDRPFRGSIAEIRISDEVVRPDEVARHWSSASRGLEAPAGGGPGVRR